jgi:hypothetical protein
MSRNRHRKGRRLYGYNQHKQSTAAQYLQIVEKKHGSTNGQSTTIFRARTTAVPMDLPPDLAADPTKKRRATADKVEAEELTVHVHHRNFEN